MVHAAYSGDFLSHKRTIGDDVVQSFVTGMLSNEDSQKNFYRWLGQVHSNAELDSLRDEFAGADFIHSNQKLPVWADEERMLKGSAFFIRHSDAIMSLLGLLSLPYCYAAADGAMVLYLTERLRERPAKRLSDTAGFIWDVMAPNAFMTDGKGFASCLKIRLTHAIARYYVSKNAAWDATLGTPVNQEDMAGTNLAFSLIVVRGLRKLGVSVSYEEQQSFMHLWNVIGYLLGLDEDLIPQDGKSATLLEVAIRQRHFKSSLQGRALTKALLEHITNELPGPLSSKDVYEIMRFLLGDDVAELLEIPNGSGGNYAPAILKLTARMPHFDSGNIRLDYRERYAAFLKTRT